MKKASREIIERMAERNGTTFHEELERLLRVAFTFETRMEEFEKLVDHYKQRKEAETQ